MFKNWFKKVEVIRIDAQVLNIKPDDILVLSYDYNLSDEQFGKLKKLWNNSPYSKNEVILLEGGGRLKVLRERG